VSLCGPLATPSGLARQCIASASNGSGPAEQVIVERRTPPAVVPVRTSWPGSSAARSELALNQASLLLAKSLRNFAFPVQRVAKTVREEDPLGFKCEINYILKLRAKEGLDESSLTPGASIAFSKDGHRIYPVDAPIDLANGDWEIIGRVAVRSICIGAGKTTGTAEVLLVHDEAARKVITHSVAKGEERNHSTGKFT